jgi:hypothetical protein
MSNTSVYIGGHKFDVEFDFTPSEKGERGAFGEQLSPDVAAEMEIIKLHLGETDINQLLIEEAVDLYDQIYAQVMTRIQEGDL